MPTEESKKEPNQAQKKLLDLAEARRHYLRGAIKQLEEIPSEESTPTSFTDRLKKIPQQLASSGNKVQLLLATRQKLQDMKHELAITDISVKPVKISPVDDSIAPENATLQQLQMLYASEENNNIVSFKKCMEDLERLFDIREENVYHALQELNKYHLDPHYYDNKTFESKEEDIGNKQIPHASTSELDNLPMETVRKRVNRIGDHLRKHERLILPFKDMPTYLQRQKEAFADRERALQIHEKDASEKLALYDIMIEKQVAFEKRYATRKALFHHYFGEDDKITGVFNDYLKAQHGRHKALDTLSDYNPRNLFTSRLPRQGRRGEYINSLRQAMLAYVNDESKLATLMKLINEGLIKKSQQNLLKKKKAPEERPLYNLLKSFEDDIKQHTLAPQDREEKEASATPPPSP